MAAVMLVMALAIAGCIIFDRKLHETLPVAVFTVTLAVYIFALVMPLKAAVWICICLTGCLIVISFVIRQTRRRTYHPKQKTWSALLLDEVSDESSNATRGNERERLLRGCISSPLVVMVIVCILFCILLSGRHVFFYDDLSYWALYAKNIFCIDKLPHLFENCSVDYKDYTPIMQILQYIAMFGRKTFNESVLFRTNVCFIYVMLLPVLSALERNTGKPVKAAAVALYVIFPHILTAQFYYRLGVDLFLALVFGYILYFIFLFDSRTNSCDVNEENGSEKSTGKSELFRITVIAVSLSFLALIKTSGIVLCIFALLFFVINEIVKNRHMSASADNNLEKSGSNRWGYKICTAWKTAAIAAFAFGAYFSWQLFLRYSGNNGYLSNRVKSGITGGSFAFPEYTGEVIANYIRHFFTYPLTRNRIGVTAFMLVIFIVAVATVCQNTDKGWVLGKPVLVMTMSGLVVFCIAHLCMYLFVFDEWEAHGLMEFDRYITQYLGGVFMFYACELITNCASTSGWPQGCNKAKEIVLLVSVVVFVVLLPYRDMGEYLIPQNYKAMYETSYEQKATNAENEWNASGIAQLDLAHDGTAKLTVVADAWDDTTQFIEYTAVPQPINRIVNVPAVESGMLNGFIMDYVDEYVYVCNNSKDSYTGDWDETSLITADGMPLRSGALYRVEGTNDDKTLRIIE